MLEMARRSYPASPDEIPEEIRALPGGELLLDSLPDARLANVDRTWSVHIELPPDQAGLEELGDPLVIVAMLAYGAGRIDDKLTEMVGMARTAGRSWTQVGQALGMSKQAAWERYSGED